MISQPPALPHFLKNDNVLYRSLPRLASPRVQCVNSQPIHKGYSSQLNVSPLGQSVQELVLCC